MIFLAQWKYQRGGILRCLGLYGSKETYYKTHTIKRQFDSALAPFQKDDRHISLRCVKDLYKSIEIHFLNNYVQKLYYYYSSPIVN